LRNRAEAMCAGLLFAVTSIHFSAVAWISARSTLFATLFVLLALLVMVRGARGRLSGGALVLYALALLSKEEAIGGLLLAGLIYFYQRNQPGSALRRNTCIGMVAVTIAYALARAAVLGPATSVAWTPGIHMLLNVSGGFLYELIPWWAFSLAGKRYAIEASTHSAWPEILALAVIPALLAVGWLLRRRRTMAFAIAWALIALIPTSAFNFRFLATDMFAQDRYYYLSSIGTCAILGILVVGLWNVSAGWRRTGVAMRSAAVVLLVAMVAGEYQQVSFRMRAWHRMTDYYRNLMTAAEAPLDATTDRSVCVVQEPIRARAYVMWWLRMSRPGWDVRPVASREEAAQYRPCIYLLVETQEGGSVSLRPMRVD
jgi:hypothetical protein